MYEVTSDLTTDINYNRMVAFSIKDLFYYHDRFLWSTFFSQKLHDT